VRITDTGHGIEKNILDRIFEPFFTTKETGKGTGMGLAAVYGTLKNIDGAIDVTSRPGEGSVFSLYFPFHELSERPGAEKQKGTQPEDIPALHVLLVDDERTVRETAKSLLEMEGHTIDAFASSADALHWYRDNYESVDIVILDFIMPELNGYDLFIRLKEINPSIRCILASGFSVTSEIYQALDEGVGQFVQKPFDIYQLRTAIAEIIKS
jgi:CheY-like chemotaxis protein